MATNIYKVHYHAEVNGKLHGAFGNRFEYISASAGDPATIEAVLSSNSRDVPAGTVFKIDAIQNVGLGTVLS